MNPSPVFIYCPICKKVQKQKPRSQMRRTHLASCLAEVKRFELLRRQNRPTGFRIRTLQPLGYISVFFKTRYRVSGRVLSTFLHFTIFLFYVYFFELRTMFFAFFFFVLFKENFLSSVLLIVRRKYYKAKKGVCQYGKNKNFKKSYFLNI